MLHRLLASRFAFLLPVAVVFALYGQLLSHDFLAIDDGGFILRNPLVSEPSFGALAKAFGTYTMLLYIPLTVVSYQLNALIAGVNPWIYHLTDMLLHAANVILIYHLILQCTRKRTMALLVALLFAVHPLQVEAVAWVSARKDVLSSTFALLSLLAYLRSFTESKKWYRLSIVSFACALLAKVSVFPLFLLLPFLEELHDRGTPWRERVMNMIPFALLAMIAVVVGSYGGQQFLVPLTPVSFVILAGKSTFHTVTQLFWPWNLSIFHVQIGEPAFDVPSVIGVVLLLLGFCTIIALWTRRQYLPAFGLAWFILFFFPTFAAAQKAGILFYASDKYAYLPSVGLLLCVGLFVHAIAEKWPAQRWVVVSVFIISSCALSWRTLTYTMEWKTSEMLYTHVLDRELSNVIALNNLGLLHAKKNKDKEALVLFQRAIAADPAVAVSYVNAAAILGRTGRTDEAFDLYERLPAILTVREVRGDPTLTKGFIMMCETMIRYGKEATCIALLRKVVELDPTSKEAANELATMERSSS